MRTKKEGFCNIRLKSSQVSVFIIIGLVILISASVFFFFKTRTAVFNPEEITELQSTPITSYVDVCVRRASFDALDILGRQGGYIYFPPYIALDPMSYVSESPISKQGKIPYWFYQGRSRIPTLDQMESDLSKYIKYNAYVCVDDYNAFRDQYDVNILENISVTVKIAEKNVQIDTSFPVDVIKKSNNQKIELRDYRSSVSVRLKESYEMSKLFLEKSLESGFFENVTLHTLLTLNPDVPLSGMDLTAVPKSWSLRDVRTRVYPFLKYVMSAKIRLQFNDAFKPFTDKRSRYDELYALDEGKALNGDYLKMDTPKDFYDYKHFFFEVFKENSFTGLQSSVHIAPDKYFLLTANPNKNGMLYSYRKPIEQGLSFPTSLIFQFWNFLYEVHYPVIFAVNDPEAMPERGPNKGFTFKIAYPVHLKDNSPAQRESISFDSFEFTPSADQCVVANDDDLFKVKKAYTRNAHQLNFWTGQIEPLKGVTVYYECPTSVCYMGNTSCSRDGCSIELRLPKSCYNGILVAQKTGFITKKMQATTDADVYDLDMVPLKAFNYTIEAYTDYQAPDDDNNGQIELVQYDLSEYHENYSVFIRLESYETGYVAQSIYDPSVVNSMNLSGGKYRIDAYLMLGSDTIIGGYHGNITITYPTLDDYDGEYDMTDRNSVTFKLFAMVPKPRDDEAEDGAMSLQELFDENKYDYLGQLKPVFD